MVALIASSVADVAPSTTKSSSSATRFSVPALTATPAALTLRTVSLPIAPTVSTLVTSTPVPADLTAASIMISYLRDEF